MSAFTDGLDVNLIDGKLVPGSGGAVFSKPVKLQLRSHLPDLFISDSFGATELGANWIPIGFDASSCDRPKECQRHLMVIAQALAGECDAFPD